jgi:hypothetical protein
VLDPSGSGYADLEMMKGMLAQMPGIGEVSDEDMKVVLELADSGVCVCVCVCVCMCVSV